MSVLSLEPISGADDIYKITQIVLIKALFTKSFCIGDFEWDDDELYLSFIELAPDNDTRNAYVAERDFALTEAKEYVTRAVQQELRRIEKVLGSHCPFIVDEREDMFLVLDDVSMFSPLAITYFYTLFHEASAHRNPWVNVDKPLLQECSRDFARLFEVASCVSLSGWTESRVWYIGRSRSVHKLMRILKMFCNFVGSGSMRDIEELDKYVRNSNDGGIDAIAVAAPQGTLSAAPMVFLLGATVQSSNRKNKVIGDQEKKRFRSLFDKQPAIGFEGVLAIPFEEDQVDVEYCRDSDCRYVHRDAVFEGMRRADSDLALQRTLRPHYSSIKRRWPSLLGKLKLDVGPSILDIC